MNSRMTLAAAALLFARVALVQAQPAPEPLKLGAILDMSSLYADVTGPGSELAARMAIADFGGKVLGRPIEFMVADHQTKADIADYLEAVLEDGDPALITHALGVIARAKGMTQIGRTAGLGRESLYKALSAQGNPEFATVMRVLEALGLRLAARPAAAKRTARKRRAA